MNAKLVYFSLLLLVSAIVIILYQVSSDSDIFKSEPELIAQALYQDNCAKCHGDDGEGAATFPDIRNQSYDLDKVKILIRHGAGEMPAFPKIKEPDLSYLAKYVSEF